MDEEMVFPNSHNNYDSIEQINQKVAIDSPDETFMNSEQLTESSKASLISRAGTCFIKMRLELFTFLFTFSSVLAKVTSTSMILSKVCLVNFAFNSSVCSDLENYSDAKNSVEKLATNYQLGRTLIQTAPSAFLACFIGPWSDRYGRKFPIILALTGMIADSIGSTVCAYFLETRVEYYFIPAVFTGLSGGLVTIMAVVYSYCSDSSSVLARTMKYAFIEMSVGFAQSIGTAAGGWIYKAFGFAAVFLFSVGGLFVSLVFGIFMLEETRGLDSSVPWSDKIRDLFSCKVFLESFTAITKHRPDRGRCQVVLLITSMCFIIIAMYSTGDISYLYAHHQFGWDNPKYSNISAICSTIGIVILIVIIPLLKYFKVTDPYLGIFGTASLIGKSLGIGLSKNIPVYYISNVIGFFGGCASFAARSRVSKIASDDDVGKLFTFVAISENLLPIITSVLISQLFVACLSFFPGMPYITLGIILVLPLGIFSWLTFLPKK